MISSEQALAPQRSGQGHRHNNVFTRFLDARGNRGSEIGDAPISPLGYRGTHAMREQAPRHARVRA
jgi:hypothetical protein